MDKLGSESDAARFSMLSDGEKELGVLLVDMKRNGTEVTVFKHGRVHAVAVVPLGGDSITGDIAMAFRIPIREAERLKREAGTALPDSVGVDETVSALAVGSDQGRQQLSRRELAEVIEACVEEILCVVRERVEDQVSLEDLQAGVVLTGGLAELCGIDQLAGKVLGVNCRAVPGRSG